MKRKTPPLPTHWSPQQALAIFEFLQAVRGQLWNMYGEHRRPQRGDRRVVRGAHSSHQASLKSQGADPLRKEVSTGGFGLCCLFVNRRFDLRSILPRLVRVAAVTGPRNRGFVRGAEVGC